MHRGGGLWAHQDFVRLWAATISTFGSLVTRTALPLTAILALDASPFDLGLLAAAELVPGFAVGLVAGAWVDHRAWRPILIGTDLGRAALLATVPVAALAGVLSLHQIYVVAAVAPLVLQQLVADPAATVYDINQVSLRPAITPGRLLGHVNASLRVLEVGAMLLGALLSGFLGETVGIRATLPAGVAILFVAAVWLLLSPIRRVCALPPSPTEDVAPRDAGLAPLNAEV